MANNVGHNHESTKAITWTKVTQVESLLGWATPNFSWDFCRPHVGGASGHILAATQNWPPCHTGFPALAWTGLRCLSWPALPAFLRCYATFCVIAKSRFDGEYWQGRGGRVMGGIRLRRGEENIWNVVHPSLEACSALSALQVILYPARHDHREAINL